MSLIPSAVTVICLDAVGTLIFPRAAVAATYAQVGRKYGSRYTAADISQRFSQAFQCEEKADRDSGWRTSEDREQARWQQIVASVLDDTADLASCFAELYAHFARPDAWECLEGTAEILAGLKRQGYRLALASNFDGRLRPVVAGLSDLVELHDIFISSEIGWRKPSPHFFQALTLQLQISPQKILHVGDSRENDYDGAVQAGLHALLLQPESAGPGTIGHLRDLLAE